VTQVQPKLSKCFTCPFCNNEKSVVAKMSYESGTGKARLSLYWLVALATALTSPRR